MSTIGEKTKQTAAKLEKEAGEKDIGLHGPVPNTIYTEPYVATLAKFIYLWGWPMVKVHNRVALFSQLKEPMYGGGVLPMAPPVSMCMLSDYILPEHRAVACPNQYVVYGVGPMDH